MSSARIEARRAAEARAWRLALLLTPSAEHAADVAIEVRRAQPKLERLEPRRLDRLIVLRSREVSARRRPRPGPAEPPGPPIDERARPLLDALRALEGQPREAWLFARLDRLGDGEIARSMDCSRTAAARFLAEADSAVEGLSDLAGRMEALDAWLGALQPHAAIALRREQRRRRRARAAAVWIALAGLVVAGGAIAAAWILCEISARDVTRGPRAPS